MGIRAFMLIASRVWTCLCFMLKKQARAVSFLKGYINNETNIPKAYQVIYIFKFTSYKLEAVLTG